eukprot:scaffold74749_cov35-Cyclotella_meneghiniana.AAC.7
MSTSQAAKDEILKKQYQDCFEGRFCPKQILKPLRSSNTSLRIWWFHAFKCRHAYGYASDWVKESYGIYDGTGIGPGADTHKLNVKKICKYIPAYPGIDATIVSTPLPLHLNIPCSQYSKLVNGCGLASLTIQHFEKLESNLVQRGDG